MAELPRVIGTHADLPEPLREALKDYYGAYTGDDPKYKGKLVLLGTDPNVEALQGTLEHERSQRGAATSKAAELERQLAEAKAEAARAAKGGGKEKGERGEGKDPEKDQALQNALERIAALETSLNEERGARTKAEQKAREDELLMNLRKGAIAGGASEDTADFVVDAMRKQIKEKDGRFVPVRPDGTTLLSKDGTVTEPMPWDELARGVISKHNFLGRPNRGADARGGDGRAGGGAGGEFTITESQSRDPRAYRTVRDAAEKAGKEVVIVPDS